jgi:hypothetical protein
LIFAMIRNLPEGSRFVAARTVDTDDTQPDEDTSHLTDPRTEAVMDQRVWTLDRRLKAMQINAIYSQIAVSGQWGKAGPPDFPTVGPMDWRDAGSTKSKEPKDNFDVLKRMGWPGG